MLRCAVLLCVLAAAAVAQEDFFENYAEQKVMTSCFGEELYYGQLTSIQQAKKQCRYQPVSIPSEHNPNTLDILSHGLLPPQVGYDYLTPSTFPTSLIPPAGYQRHLDDSIRKARHTRDQLHADRDTVLAMIDRTQAALSNYTCALRNLNLVDDNLDIRLDTIQREYHRIPIEPALRQDMLEGIDLCYQLSTCLPEKTKNPLPHNLQRLLFFNKCEKEQRLARCFKHDLRRNLFRFDLSVLPDSSHERKLEKLVTILVVPEIIDDLDEI